MRVPPIVVAAMLVLALAAASSATAAPAPDASPSALVQVSPVVEVPWKDTLTAYGTVEFSPEHSRAITLQAEGLVTRVFVAAGQQVKRGEPLVGVRPTPVAQLDLERARIDVEFARKDVERVEALRRRQLATNAQVEAAQAQAAKAEAILQSLAKRVGGVAAQTLRAPVNGTVEAIGVREGDVAAPGTPLLRLANADSLRVRLGVEPSDVARVRPGQPVDVTPVTEATDRPHRVTARTAEVYRRVNPKTRLADVIVPLPAGAPLLPGARVRGEIVVRERARVPAVPRSAVLDDHGRPYVFVVQGGRAVRRWIEAGADDGRYVEIRSGVAAGEPVVTLGNYELRDGMRVRVPSPGR